MREILYRGQIRRKGEKVHFVTGEPQPSRWCYGGIFAPHMEAHGFGVIYGQESGSDEPITGTKLDKFPVYRDTIGQYTGLQDKNGKRVFEGDICRVVYLDRRCNSSGEHYDAENVITEEVVFEKGTFCFKTTIEDIALYRPIGFEVYEKQKIKCFEVIGNIYDNPELLREDEE